MAKISKPATTPAGRLLPIASEHGCVTMAASSIS
jgi:hypothetical protein